MKLKRFFLTACIVFASSLVVFAQGGQPNYTFTVIKENPITSIKNQYRSGTCWCFSAISFLESEAIRINKIKDTLKYPDFSEMFIVSHSYKDRADKYVKLDGNLTFGAGSECEDVIHVMDKYGLVPQSAMPGLNYGTDLPVHGELDATTKAYVETIKTVPNKVLSTAWKRGFCGIVDAYLGVPPTKFMFNGKEMTPIEYRDYYKLHGDNYVSFASFADYPFYTKIPLEVADNWRGDMVYNLPVDEFINLLFSSIEKGYTTTWGGDVSEAGFTRTGLGVLVDTKKATSGSDQERWVGKSNEKKSENFAPVQEVVTQETRQKGFDQKTTTDDHGMHAYGVAKDQFGNRYLIVKNSWGQTGDYKGIWYISENYCKAKLIDFMVNKDALPKDLKKKLGIK